MPVLPKNPQTGKRQAQLRKDQAFLRAQLARQARIREGLVAIVEQLKRDAAEIAGRFGCDPHETERLVFERGQDGVQGLIADMARMVILERRTKRALAAVEIQIGLAEDTPRRGSRIDARKLIRKSRGYIGQAGPPDPKRQRRSTVLPGAAVDPQRGLSITRGRWPQKYDLQPAATINFCGDADFCADDPRGDRLFADAVVTRVLDIIEAHRPRELTTIVEVCGWLDQVLAAMQHKPP